MGTSKKKTKKSGENYVFHTSEEDEEEDSDIKDFDIFVLTNKSGAKG